MRHWSRKSGEVTVLVLVVAMRWMGVHASSLSMCRCCTFMLLFWMPWPSPVWFFAGALAWQRPLLPPKKKTEAEKLVEARAQVEAFFQQHGRAPVWDDTVPEGRALLGKLKRGKLLHVLSEVKDRRVLEAASNFLVEEGRLPKRGPQRERENNLAQQWERLLREREKLPRDLQEDFAALFRAVEDASAAGQVSVCVAVEQFLASNGRLPQRYSWGTLGDSAAKREENALAQRWERLQQQEVEDSVRLRFDALFSAAEDASAAGQVAVCVAVQLFWETSGRLPRRQVGDSAAKREEDALAQRWDRLQQHEVEESVRLRFDALFSAAEDASAAGQVAVCVAVQLFWETSGRLPRRQVGDSAAKREEDALAQRWDRLQQHEVEESVRLRFDALFSAAEDGSAAGQVAVCVAVQLFWETSGRLPRRQVGDSAAKREEDALAQRWDRLQQHEVEESVRLRFDALFSAAEDASAAGQVAICVAVQLFWETSGRLPRRQVGDSAAKREEDALAQRWDRLQQHEVEESARLRFDALFSAAEDASAAGQVAVCVAVQLFWETSGRLPRRQVGDSAAKREEDALAQRWDRLQQHEVEESLRKQFVGLFSASEAESERGVRWGGSGCR